MKYRLLIGALSVAVLLTFSAGVRPSEIQGWVYGKVEVMGKNGKTEQVDRLLKPFDIE